MINLLKKNFALLLAVVLCLSLTACGDSKKTDAGKPDVNIPDIGGNYDVDPDLGGDDVGGTDWRTTGIWCSGGTITRDGEDTDVLVCVHKADANFYYDMEDQVLYDNVDYPITLEGDAREAFWNIDFADLTGDGNSDVTMMLNDGGNELLLVWYWDTESHQFEFWPEESQLCDYDLNEDFGYNNPGFKKQVMTNKELKWFADIIDALRQENIFCKKEANV